MFVLGGAGENNKTYAYVQHISRYFVKPGGQRDSHAMPQPSTHAHVHRYIRLPFVSISFYDRVAAFRAYQHRNSMSGTQAINEFSALVCLPRHFFPLTQKMGMRVLGSYNLPLLIPLPPWSANPAATLRMTISQPFFPHPLTTNTAETLFPPGAPKPQKPLVGFRKLSARQVPPHVGAVPLQNEGCFESHQMRQSSDFRPWWERHFVINLQSGVTYVDVWCGIY